MSFASLVFNTIELLRLSFIQKLYHLHSKLKYVLASADKASTFSFLFLVEQAPFLFHTNLCTR